MHQHLKLRSLGLVVGSLLLAAACRERTPDNPDPKYPPPHITITFPAGSRPGDPAKFDAIMRGDTVPDTNYRAKPADRRRY